jgi:hypothetical protein
MDADSFGGGTAPVPGADGGAAGTEDADEGGEDTSGGAGSSGDAAGGDQGIFDVPTGGGSGGIDPDESDGCTKVDLLFVIDNSESMSGEQANLIASFDGFVDEMKAALAEAEDFHIGVTTTDANFGNAAGCTLDGALVTATTGENSSAAACGPYAAGGAYMTDADDLYDAFGCAAQVGTGGIPFERPMDTMRAAVGPGLQGVGGCNEGFTRPDALLVVVIITDEEDHLQSEVIQNGSQGDPADWYADLVALRGGVEQNIVVLSLVGVPAPNDCPLDGGDHDGAQWARRIIEFTEMFTHGTVGDVCAPQYDGFFADAVAVIDLACDEFQPAG